MSNDLQTNLGYFMMINYDSFSLCHLRNIFFAMHVGAKELRITHHKLGQSYNGIRETSGNFSYHNKVMTLLFVTTV